MATTARKSDDVRSLFLDPANDDHALEHFMQRICRPYAQKKKLLISISEARLVEVIASARSTAEFHKIDKERISRYKEYAHIGYWLVRHKPVSIITPETKHRLIKQTLEASAVEFNRFLSGYDVRIVEQLNERSRKAYENDVEHYRADGDKPINERVALLFIWYHCELGWLQQISKLTDHDLRGVFEQKVATLKERFHSEVFADLVWSLRYHNFTPRAFASCIEALLRLDIVKHDGEVSA
jgi:hypothetical protein